MFAWLNALLDKTGWSDNTKQTALEIIVVIAIAICAYWASKLFELIIQLARAL